MIDLAVVTSCWGDYGVYLPEWARSIAGQTELPRQAVIMDGGIRARESLAEALDILTDIGVEPRHVRGPNSPMGAARNAAMAQADTAWAMHLDADDFLLPHCLEDVAQRMGRADVVSIGAIRGSRVTTFPYVNRRVILRGIHGCYSCAPFRRELWERRPWHTRNDWVDSTFWVGLAHLGARFVGTDRPGFIYRSHPGSFSNRMPHRDRRRAMRQWKEACREWTLTP